MLVAMGFREVDNVVANEVFQGAGQAMIIQLVSNLSKSTADPEAAMTWRESRRIS